MLDGICATSEMIDAQKALRSLNSRITEFQGRMTKHKAACVEAKALLETAEGRYESVLARAALGEASAGELTKVRKDVVAARDAFNEAEDKLGGMKDGMDLLFKRREELGGRVIRLKQRYLNTEVNKRMKEATRTLQEILDDYAGLLSLTGGDIEAEVKVKGMLYNARQAGDAKAKTVLRALDTAGEQHATAAAA